MFVNLKKTILLYRIRQKSFKLLLHQILMAFTECYSEKILKICQYLSKMWTKVVSLLLAHPVDINSCKYRDQTFQLVCCFNSCGKEEREAHIAACIGDADVDMVW